MKRSHAFVRLAGPFAALALCAVGCIPTSSDVTPQKILEHANTVLDDMQQQVAGGKKEKAKDAARLFTAITNFTEWAQVVGSPDAWGLDSLVAVADGIDFSDPRGTFESDFGIQRSPALDRRLHPLLENRGKYILFDADPPTDKYRFFLIGRGIGDDVVSVLEGEGLWSAITVAEYRHRYDEARIAFKDQAGVDLDKKIAEAEWNKLLVSYARSIGLPMPPRQGEIAGIPYSWIAIGVAVVAVVLALLAIGFMIIKGGKKPPLATCPICHTVLVNGVCPRCNPPATCPTCHTVLVNGQCPRGCLPPATCPTCHAVLVNGACPEGHTIPRCSRCGAILFEGKCPKGCVEPEICPTCHSELVHKCCPKGHTIIRCAECGKIMVEGVCPSGCNADPLSLGWGRTKPEMSPFALEVVAEPPCNDPGRTGRHLGSRCRLPVDTVIGRSSKFATEPYIELLIRDETKKGECSRRYVRLSYDAAKGVVLVTLLKTSGNVAWVGGEKLVREGDQAELREGGLLKLNPGYELRLVRAA